MQLRVRSLFPFPFSSRTRVRSPRGDPPVATLPRSTSVEDKGILLDLHKRYLRYFIDSQHDSGPVSGCIRDRRNNANRGSSQGEKISTSATGMGFIAIALASNPRHGLLTRQEAITRVGTGIESALSFQHELGMTHHFMEADGTNTDWDAIATIDTSWLIAGALWAAQYLHSETLTALASKLYDRVDWRHWTHGHKENLICHGRHIHGHVLETLWDHFNGETLLLYVLATGAKDDVALPVTVWRALQQFNGETLGLFTDGMGMELFDAEQHLTHYTGVNLLEKAAKAIDAHIAAAGEHLWGSSDGDCPEGPDGQSRYQEVSPGHSDGTINTNVVVSSLRAHPSAVLRNVARAVGVAELDGKMGHYGVPNMKQITDRWIYTNEAVAIDLGVAAMAITNFLYEEEVRRTFHEIPIVQRAIERIQAATRS